MPGVPCRNPCADSNVDSCPAGPIFDDAEIQHLQIVVLVSETGDEEVGRLDVAMHKAVFVRLGERTARLAQEHDDPLGGLRSEALHHAVQVQAFEQLHDVVEVAAVGHAEIVELHRMRRAQAGGDLRLALESPHELLTCRARPARCVESASRPPDAPGGGVGRARPRPCRRSPVAP